MKMQHVNITIPVDLKLRLDAESKSEHIPRSTLIQKAVRIYLGMIKHKRMKALLQEGYIETANESIKLTQEFEKLDGEVSKYVD